MPILYLSYATVNAMSPTQTEGTFYFHKINQGVGSVVQGRYYRFIILE